VDLKLSKDFWSTEFECKCGCKAYIPNAELVEVLQDTRDHFQQPVKVTSSTRCQTHNKAIGGVNRSKHLLGEAADIQVLNIPPAAVQAYLYGKYFEMYGIGSYTSFTHIDVRPGPQRRWDG